MIVSGNYGNKDILMCQPQLTDGERDTQDTIDSTVVIPYQS